jgi:hypothetical protein
LTASGQGSDASGVVDFLADELPGFHRVGQWGPSMHADLDREWSEWRQNRIGTMALLYSDGPFCRLHRITEDEEVSVAFGLDYSPAVTGQISLDPLSVRHEDRRQISHIPGRDVGSLEACLESNRVDQIREDHRKELVGHGKTP